uniref:Uncharacterized protein n=1 Tax=Esox lucius TaxID=8010 RepID=A0AAY5K1U9_ESOLU
MNGSNSKHLTHEETSVDRKNKKMNRTLSKSNCSLQYCAIVEVKSKYGAEFRRFSLDRFNPGEFQDFYKLILCLHHLTSIDIMIGYADIQGALLPINNNDNFRKAVSTASTLLRIFIQRQGIKPRIQPGKVSHFKLMPIIHISRPLDFRPVSSVIDADVLPETQRRVRLYRQGSGKPLGFYIRDGTTMRVTPHGLEKVPGVFISRLVPGGLAESTGLLAINDEVLEVNGIEVAGKALDQVTDMMVANSHNLIITVKPVSQRNNIVRTNSWMSGMITGSVGSLDNPSYHCMPVSVGAHSFTDDELQSDEDVVIESRLKNSTHHSSASMASRLQGLGPAESQPQALPKATQQAFPQGPPQGHLPVALRAGLTLSSPQPPVTHSRVSMGHSTAATQTELRRSLLLQRGGVEEDGIVITL